MKKIILFLLLSTAIYGQNQSRLASLATADATLTGTPTAPTAAPGTNTTQIATTAFVQAVARPYKVYTALLVQSGTNAPVATVLENTLGGTIVWSRNGAGDYSATLTGGFILNKTAMFMTDSFSLYKSRLRRFNADILSLYTTQAGNSTTVDSALDSTVEIRVYN